ncbi:hypothetical protein SAURM35S_06399 [Streptomyces aurantiogriseus]
MGFRTYSCVSDPAEHSEYTEYDEHSEHRRYPLPGKEERCVFRGT